MATVDDKKIIFSMVGVSKIIPQNQKQILKNIYLSFFYGAKIGIIGLNGAGKSTLMKIIAGLEQPTQGEVVWSPGYSVGYLPQDPPLDENKTVKENVMEGVQKIYDALAEYEDINNKFGLEEYYGDPDKMDKLLLVGLIILLPINRNVHWHAFLSVVSGHIIVIAGYVRIFGENVTSIKFLVWKPWENMNQHIHGAMKV